ncbi:MAG TPA: NADP-dependent phosphogluconate dehydrogenase [Candidatus Saccharimonadales bacterium]|nr:NADP-dependent phosphogluconate dehydrogenase [Candidatus Saccharimonadales bacterium]
MTIGFSGLGKMGSQLVQRLLSAGHQVYVVNRSPEPVDKMLAQGAQRGESLENLTQVLKPVIIWLMVPADIVDQQFETVLAKAPEGAIIIDGGNSDFRLTQARAAKAQAKGVHFIDVGTSGGILGGKNGFSMMVGGDTEAVKSISPIIDALAHPYGWHHFGPAGAGHFVKMVHNAIEYGMMESYAEGYRMLKEGPIAELDLVNAGRVWQHGSIIESLLNQLTMEALEENPSLEGVEGVVAESGEARWTLELANQMNLPMPAIQAAFDVRLKSQQGEVNYATKLLAAMRNKFGGHQINPNQ